MLAVAKVRVRVGAVVGVVGVVLVVVPVVRCMCPWLRSKNIEV
jgi:hypothetical protein